MGVFLDSLGKFTDFLDVFNKDPQSGAANFVTLLGTGYTVISEIAAHVNGDGTFSPPKEDKDAIILEQLEGISEELGRLEDSLATMEENLTDLIVDQFTGIRQQALASAVSRAQSAADLLALREVSDGVDASEIIADASRALRDTLSQALEMVTPTFEYQPSFSSFGAAVNAVAYVVGVRINVAAQLESNEIAATGINRQINDVATFLDNIIPTLRGEFGLQSAVKNGVDQATGKGWFQVVLDIDDEDFLTAYSDAFDSGDLGDVDLFSTRPAANIFRLTYDADNVVSFGGIDYDLDDLAERDDLTDLMLRFLQDEALRFLGIEPDESKPGSLPNTISGLREQADGVQLVLPSKPGFPNDGTLTGSDGNDLIIGNDGDDELFGMGDADIIRGKEGDDLLSGGEGNDRLYGGAGDDTLLGGDDNDLLVGGAGDDDLQGGAGVDAVYYADKRAFYTIGEPDPSTGRIIVEGPDGTDSLLGVEQIIFDDRTIIIARGGFAGETIIGDITDQSYSFLQLGGALAAANLPTEDILLGGGGSDTLMGLALDDRLDGGLGNDTLIGGSGADLLDGGIGSSTADTAVFQGDLADYEISAHKDNILVSGPDGNDIVRRMDWLQFDDVSVKTNFIDPTTPTPKVVAGDGGEALIGNYRDDELVGGKGDDIFSGFTGDDEIDGGAGDDAAFFSGRFDRYTISSSGKKLLVSGVDGDDTLVGIEKIAFDDRVFDVRLGSSQSDNGAPLDPNKSGLGDLLGSWQDDIILGRAGDDTLKGFSGNDVLIGGGGNDLLLGSAGTDIARIASNLSDVQIEVNADQLIIDGQDGRDTLEDVEVLAFDDAVLGIIQESGGSGSVKGTKKQDIIVAGSGDEVLKAKKGDDFVFAEKGDDKVKAGAGHDFVDGGAGRDALFGQSGNDQIFGGSGSDSLRGGKGSDALTGGAGDDILRGQKGVDSFHFDGTRNEGHDTIKGFGVGRETLVLTNCTRSDVTVSQKGAGTLIELASGTEIFLTKVAFSDFTDSNLMFV